MENNLRNLLVNGKYMDKPWYMWLGKQSYGPDLGKSSLSQLRAAFHWKRQEQELKDMEKGLLATGSKCRKTVEYYI